MVLVDVSVKAFIEITVHVVYKCNISNIIMGYKPLLRHLLIFLLWTSGLPYTHALYVS